ncbi:MULTISPECIES: GNAT family N-acetyltransferase [Flavobacterium]|uniref:Acetyltransferase (GNAT) family protein n=1 Tax=Flavobacterium anhuiense TaxID=459526 RepID=A0AAC9D1B4_9FLAO|nr:MULTISPECIES: GNAT family N-acetyltransferase [Flavobacterium]AOC95779.1 Acetyltransferase (GNAT) family protein [Flavobacterium anhuiense]EJF99662.1 N-acetyltransferase GCN5 [Flavobacterium sp. F52]
MNTTEKLSLRKANLSEIPQIWEILQDAIEQRRLDGSTQWQDGYPNELSIKSDIENGYGYVFTEDESILAYAAIIFDKEPAYENIEGKWLTDGDYTVVHRVAVSKLAKGKGIATKLFQSIEGLSVENNIYSIKVDTNFDNTPMLKILDRLKYTYCGEVYFRGSARKAFEKRLI